MKKNETNNKANNKTNISNVESDYITNRVLTAFGAGILLIIASSMMSRGMNYEHSAMFTIKFMRIARYAGLGIALLGALFSLWQALNHKYNSKTLFNGTGLAMFSALFAFCAYLVLAFGGDRALRTIYIIIPVCALLYLIYSVYPREFFTMSCVLTSTALFTWLVSQSQGSNSMEGFTLVFLVCGITVCVLAELAFLLAAKNDGAIKIGKFQLHVFEPTTRHSLVASICAFSLAILLLAFFLGAPMSYYAMFAVISVLFVVAVYYTVKMM